MVGRQTTGYAMMSLWCLPYKKFLKPSLLSIPKATTLGCAFIISYLKPALASSPLFSASVVSLQSFIYDSARKMVLKVQTG